MMTAALRDLGMPIHNILFSKSYSSAIEISKSEKPKLFISEYEIRGRYGLELLEEIKQFIEEPIFILATSTASETSVAEAAEEDVDAYIVKPYMGNQLRLYIRRAIEYRIDPPPYICKIQDGRKLMETEKFDDAKRAFFEASTIGEKPSLALYYLGQINEHESDPDLALEMYNSGLEYIPIHYKCLSAKFQTLDNLKRPKEAYAVVKKIMQHYPVTPQKLGRMIYLAMITKHFTDVESYYDIYMRLENRTDKLRFIVKTALFTAGKFLVQEKEFQRAYSLFEKSILCSKRNPEIILNSIQQLINVNQIQLAEGILNLSSQDDLENPQIRIAEFLFIKSQGDRSQTIQAGTELIQDGIADYEVFDTVIQYLKLEGSERQSGKYLNMGLSKFPDLKKYLS